MSVYQFPGFPFTEQPHINRPEKYLKMSKNQCPSGRYTTAKSKPFAKTSGALKPSGCWAMSRANLASHSCGLACSNLANVASRLGLMLFWGFLWVFEALFVFLKKIEGLPSGSFIVSCVFNVLRRPKTCVVFSISL